MKKYFPFIFVIISIITIALYGFQQSGPGSGLKWKSGWKSGVALYSFNKFSFREAIDKADSINANYVEGFFFHKLGDEFNGHSIPALTDEEIKKMKGMLDERGLKMKSLYADGKTEDDWKANFVFARKMGLEFLNGEPQKKHWDAIEKLAAEYKIKVAIHEHAKGSKLLLASRFCGAGHERTPAFLCLCRHRPLGRSGLDPVKCLQTLQGKIICLHIKDLDAAGNLKANDVMVGTGVVDYPAVIAELKRQHFDGYMYIEREGNWDKNITDVDHALKYLDRLNR